MFAEVNFHAKRIPVILFLLIISYVYKPLPFLAPFFIFTGSEARFTKGFIAFEETGFKLFLPLIMGSISSKTFTKCSKKIPRSLRSRFAKVKRLFYAFYLG